MSPSLSPPQPPPPPPPPPPPLTSASFSFIHSRFLFFFFYLGNKEVQGEAQGPDESLQKLLKDIDRGPSAAHVVKVEKSEVEVREGERGFEAM